MNGPTNYADQSGLLV